MKLTSNKQQKEEITSKMLDIELKDRLSSTSIDEISKNPPLLDDYLNSSDGNSFSELIFRLTHERYKENEAYELWQAILEHKDMLNKKLKRDVGILVAALDYLTNINNIISSPKIIDDGLLEKTIETGTKDALTGLYTRRIFDFYLEREFVESARYNKPLSLIMLDIDNFKSVNDLYGHQKGDCVLKHIGKIVVKTCRHSDLPARYGGEEISVVLPETPIGEAFVLAERLRKEIYKFYKSKQPQITVSIGVAAFNKKNRSSSDLIKDADKALYQAKAAGKNKVIKCHQMP